MSNNTVTTNTSSRNSEQKIRELLGELCLIFGQHLNDEHQYDIGFEYDVTAHIEKIVDFFNKKVAKP